MPPGPACGGEPVGELGGIGVADRDAAGMIGCPGMEGLSLADGTLAGDLPAESLPAAARPRTVKTASDGGHVNH